MCVNTQNTYTAETHDEELIPTSNSQYSKDISCNYQDTKLYCTLGNIDIKNFDEFRFDKIKVDELLRVPRRLLNVFKFNQNLCTLGAHKGERSLINKFDEKY